MNSDKDLELHVARHRGCNRATSGDQHATTDATGDATQGLKPLADKVLQRNQGGNPYATEANQACNFQGKKEGVKVASESADLQRHNARAREDLDRLFTVEILPELCHLHISGNLPNLAKDQLWMAIEAEWDQASAHSPLACNVDRVKGLMKEFLSALNKEARS